MHFLRNLNTELSPPIELAVATGEDAHISATPVRAPEGQKPFWELPVTPENYQRGLQSIRDAVNREFPDLAGKIAIADMSLIKPDDIIRNAAIQLNLQNDPNFITTFAEHARKRGGYITGESIPYTGPDGQIYSVSFGDYPKDYKNMGMVMWKNLHEVGHGLDFDTRNTAANAEAKSLAYRAHEDVRKESFAETFSRTAMVMSGLYGRHVLRDAYANYTSSFGEAHLSGMYDGYQPYEALRYVDTHLKGKFPTNTDGRVGNLRSAYELSKAGIDAGGYAPHDTLARGALEEAYATLSAHYLGGSKKLSREWMELHDKLPEAERTLRAQEYLEKKIPSPYTSWERPDYVKGYAQALVYSHDNPDDLTVLHIVEAYRNVANKQNTIQGPSNFTADVAHKLEKDISLARRIADGGPQGELYQMPGQTKAPAVGPSQTPSARQGFKP